MDSLKKLMKTGDLWISGDRLVSRDTGHEFEKYVEHLFVTDNEYFSVAEKTRDSGERTGIPAENTPGLVIRYLPENEVFAVVCTWRANPFYNRKIRNYVIKWAEPHQIENYRHYSREMKMPVFIVIGLAGRPGNPGYTFCLPLEEAKNPELFSGVLDTGERDPPDKPFIWDTKNKRLR
jgi:hypothetical protein